MDCSTIILKVAIWSTQDLPDPNPACSFLNFASRTVFSLSNMIRVSMLLDTDSSMIPLQFPQWLRSPFYGTFISIKRPCFHSSRITSISQITFKRSAVVLGSVFQISGGILSPPVALPFFKIINCILNLILTYFTTVNTEFLHRHRQVLYLSLGWSIQHLLKMLFPPFDLIIFF